MGTLTAAREALERDLAEKDSVVEETKVELEGIQNERNNLADEVEKLRKDYASLQTQVDYEHDASEKHTALQSRIEELESQKQEQDGLIQQLTQEVDDYKHDCAGLWQQSEDLKQQLALASADTLVKEAELQKDAMSGQSALEDKVSELEQQLEVLREQLSEKTQELANAQAGHQDSSSLFGNSSLPTDSEGYALLRVWCFVMGRLLTFCHAMNNTASTVGILLSGF